MKWFAYRFLGTDYSAFHVRISRIALYGIIVLFSLFYNPIKKKCLSLNELIEKRFIKLPTVKAETSNIPKYFAITALVVGIFLVFFVTPLNAPDEPTHFSRSYALANGQFLSTIDSSGKAVSYVNSDFDNFNVAWPHKIIFDINKKITYGELITSVNSVNTAVQNNVKETFVTPNAVFLLYAPQAIGIDIGKIVFGLTGNNYNTYNQLIFARLFNLLYFVLLTYLALKLTPVYKRTLMLIALMPQTLFLASSCSYDVFVFTSCFLFTALVFRCAYDKNKQVVAKSDLIALCITGSLVALCKYVYIPMLLMLLLIPKEKFQSLKKKANSIAVIICTSFAVLGLWLIIFKLSTRGMVPDQYSALQKEQLEFILKNPIKYCVIMLYDIFYNRSLYLSGFVARPGWADIFVPMSLILIYFLFIILSAFFEKFPYKLQNRNRFMLFAALVVSYVLIATGEYVSWTVRPDVGTLKGNLILGVQGRYFIPVALMGVFILANRISARLKIPEKINTVINKGAIVAPAASALVTIYFAFLRVYIK